MKKYLLIFLLACSAAWTAQAQTTFNVRAGGGAGTNHSYCYIDYGYSYGYRRYVGLNGMAGSVSILLQANIGLNKRNTVTFSPTVMYSPVFDDMSTQTFALPLFFGYKIPLTKAAILFPKIGPCVGVKLNETHVMVGPAIELAIEKNHFVTAFDYYYSTPNAGHHQLAFTVGYKF